MSISIHLSGSRLETRPSEFFIHDLRSADVHALYENGFGADFVDAVYTAVFGGDTPKVQKSFRQTS